MKVFGIMILCYFIILLIMVVMVQVVGINSWQVGAVLGLFVWGLVLCVVFIFYVF